MTRFLSRALRTLASTAGWLSGLSLVTIFIVGMSNVIGRYTGMFSLLWSADFQRLLFIWAVFLGTAAAHHSHSHLAIDFLRDRFSPRIRRAAVMVSNLLLLVLLGVLVFYGWEVSMLRRNVPYVQLGISHSYAFVALPLSATLMVLFTIETIVRDLRGIPSEDRETAESLM